MKDFLRPRKKEVDLRLLRLAESPSGVTRQEAHHSLSPIGFSSLDLVLRRLVEEGLMTFQMEWRDRLGYRGTVRKQVRVYYSLSQRCDNLGVPRMR